MDFTNPVAVVNGVQPEYFLYELDLEAGTIRSHFDAEGDRGVTTLTGLLVWSLWIGFEILICSYFWVFLSGVIWWAKVAGRRYCSGHGTPTADLWR